VIVAYSYIPVADPAAGEWFRNAIQNRSRSVEEFPGFIRFEFRQELGRSPRFVIATWWETRDDLRRYMGSPEHRRTHGMVPAELRTGLGRAQVEIHEVLEVSG
jgi:heme-degrading monooxygenase HmoA